MSGLFQVVPVGMVLTSGANSALTWTNAMSVSSLSASTLNASNLTVSTLATSSSVTAASLVASTLTTGRLNYSSIVGSSISTNSMTLSLTNNSTQNTQIYQVATTNPTTSYTAIQASHVSTGTTNNALALNPSGGNVGVGIATPSAPLQVNASTSSGLANGVLLVNANNTLSSTINSFDVLQQWNESTGGNINNVNLLWNRTSTGTNWTTASQRLQARTDASWQGFIEFNGTNNNHGVTIGSGVGSTPNDIPGRMYISSNGNVGIGTTAPAQLLDITNATSATPAIRVQNQYSAGYVSMGVNVGVNTYIGLQAGAATTSALGTPPLVVSNNGNVGIGTTAPTTLLDVKNGTNADSTGQPTGPFAARIYNATNASQQGGLFIKNNWSATNATLLEVGNDYVGGSYCSYLSIDGVGNTRFKVNNGSGTSKDSLFLQQITGNVGIGTTAPIAPLHVSGTTAGNDIALFFLNASRVAAINASVNAVALGWNTANSILYVARDSATNRSINAAGTINASGADYAEYMTKDSDFLAQKGDLLGVLPSGKLTNQFDDAIHFLLKSTNPCMVGGDVWGTDAIVGEKPKEPENATEEEKAAHAAALAAWEARLEAERQKVDRMAFAGQVPVNIQGTTPGDYIIPLRNADGTIGVAAVSKADMTFSQYQSAVGRVISILADGRANVIVKAV